MSAPTCPKCGAAVVRLLDHKGRRFDWCDQCQKSEKAPTFEAELASLREQLERVTKERDEAVAKVAELEAHREHWRLSSVCRELAMKRDQWRECAVGLRVALLAAVARLGNALSMTTGKAVEGPVPGALDTLTKVTESLATFDKLEGGAS